MDKIKLVLLISLMFLASNADAGVSVCPDQDGAITYHRSSGNPVANCHYFMAGEDANYDAVKVLLKTTPKRFLDIVGKDVVKKSQVDIDAILLEEQTASDTAQDLSLRTGAKGYMDDLESQGLVLRALAETLIEEINTLRAEHSLAPRTLIQLKTSIKSKIDSGEVD
jgi:hypothetical protein